MPHNKIPITTLISFYRSDLLIFISRLKELSTANLERIQLSPWLAESFFRVLHNSMTDPNCIRIIDNVKLGYSENKDLRFGSLP